MAKITDMSAPAKIGVVVLGAVLLTAVLYFVIYKSIADQNEADAKSLAGKRAEIAQLEPYQNKLNEMNRSIDALKQQLDLQKRIVPDEKEVPNFIKLMQGEAQKSNIEIRRYSANAVSSKEFYSEVPFYIELDGPYYSVLDFFQRISKVERIINISNLAMASTGKPGGAKLRRTYKYEPNESVVASCLATTFFSHDPAPAPAPAGK